MIKAVEKQLFSGAIRKKGFTFIMFGNMGTPEILIVLVIVLLLFGPKNLPRLAQSIGKSIRELKNGLSGLSDDIKDTVQTPPERPVAKSVTPTEPERPVQTESSDITKKPDQPAV
jgi:sec-independent protein translocase protein TatA